MIWTNNTIIKHLNQNNMSHYTNKSEETDTKPPCNLDHNGECLICDCWISNCAYLRYLKGDYEFETKEELEQMFKKD